MTTTTAVIIGGGLAGHCCAQFLTRQSSHVIMVDRDELPDGVDARAGVPQSRHAHVILDRGRRELERFFPGFGRRMTERGAAFVDPGLQFAALGPSGWSPRIPTEARMVCASRDLTDATLRELRGARANLEIRTSTEVTALRVAGGRVTGVEVRHRGTGATEVVRADLVIDASGRATKIPSLLQAAGVAVPDETIVDSGTWYSTRWFEAPADHRPPDDRWWRAAIIVPTLGHRGALLMPIEHGRWIVSIASVALGQPRIDEAGFLAALRELRSPIIAEAVCEPCTPCSPVYGSRSTPNRLRHYGTWQQPVAGFVALGDAVCALNPIHGQGVSCTAVMARLLETAIDDGGVTSPTLAARFWKAQARWIAEPWGSATGFDLRFPSTAGKRKLAPKLVAPYLKLFGAAMREDVALLRKVAEVGQLNQPAATLMGWDVMARVLKSTMRRGFRRASRPGAIAAYPPPTITA